MLVIVFLQITLFGTSNSILGSLAALSNNASDAILTPGDIHPPK